MNVESLEMKNYWKKKNDDTRSEEVWTKNSDFINVNDPNKKKKNRKDAKDIMKLRF